MAKSHVRVPDGGTRPIDRILSPIESFLRIEAAGGMLLLACTVIALVWANSPWGDAYDHFWHTYLKVGFGDAQLKMSLAHFVNDGLMAIFFFVVGLEIKREILVGELSSMRKAAIPIAAAIGGMVVPAGLYALLGGGGEAARGWAIPMATDIAFAVGVMALLGKRVPLSLKVFLTALAIVDDIGAVLVIAFFYTDHITVTALLLANGALVVSIIGGRLGVRSPIFYGLIGLFVWVMLLKSGVHATIGGVLVALTIPASMRIDGKSFVAFARTSIDEIEKTSLAKDHILTDQAGQATLRGIEVASERVQTPLNRLEHGLHPWVSYVIMPIFALANAGVVLGAGIGEATGAGVGIGIVAGLFLGKPLGVLGASWLAVKAGLGELPQGTNWKQIAATGCLAGIGFTMSLFIANLAFREDGMLQVAKMGILGGSLLSGILGMVLLWRSCRAPEE